MEMVKAKGLSAGECNFEPVAQVILACFLTGTYIPNQKPGSVNVSFAGPN
jgi:hypothetical protein